MHGHGDVAQYDVYWKVRAVDVPSKIVNVRQRHDVEDPQKPLEGIDFIVERALREEQRLEKPTFQPFQHRSRL